MFRKVFPIVLALLLFFSLFCITAHGDSAVSIQTELPMTANKGYVCTLSLTNYNGQGTQILTELYDKAGTLKSTKTYTPAATVQLAFPDAQSSDIARIVWKNTDSSLVCDEVTLRFNAIQTRSFMEFAALTTDINQTYEELVSINTADDSDYSSARLIVKTDGTIPNLSEFDFERMIADTENYFIIQFRTAEEAKACAEYLNALSYVVYAEPDTIVTIDSENIPFDSADFYSWGVTAINADDYAANLVNRGKTPTIIVAVVDSGLQTSHPLVKSRVVSGYDFVDGDSTPQDGRGHGTHVSGTVVDCTPNLNIKVMPVRVLDNDGRGYSSDVGNGIRYAADNGADVINLSLGGSCNSYKENAISYALNKGITVVVSAGNDNVDVNANSYCPAHISGAITVSAVNSSKNKADFSNYGNAVDIAAPGVSIRSSVPTNSYAYYNGTSMSAPHVSAAAAMLLCDFPGASPSTISSKLRGAATDIGSTGWDKYYGAGFLNLQPFVKTPPTTYSLYLPKDLTSIETEAFMGDKFTTVYLNNKVTSIGARAFKNCTNLTYIYIPSSVTSIASDAFSGSSNVIIVCPKNSEAHSYAVNKNLAFYLTTN